MPQQRLRIVVIGGSAAGPKATAKARRSDEFADITVIQNERDHSMVSCGFPYYVGGNVDDRNLLICTPARWSPTATVSTICPLKRIHWPPSPVRIPTDVTALSVAVPTMFTKIVG